MQFKEKTTTHQVAVLQQVWKRLKNAEVQTIHQIMDATGLQFDSVCEVLYDYAELQTSFSCFKTKDVSMMCRSTRQKWKWGTRFSSSPRKVLLGAILTKNRSIKFLNCFSLAAKHPKTTYPIIDCHVYLYNGGVV